MFRMALIGFARGKLDDVNSFPTYIKIPNSFTLTLIIKVIN